jgi:hypothetical protein
MDTALDGLFVNASRYGSSVPEHILGEADVERDYVHALLILSRWIHKGSGTIGYTVVAGSASIRHGGAGETDYGS